VLALQRPTKALSYGTNVRVSGRARGATSPSLEMRESGATWHMVRTLAPNDSGLFSLLLKPRSTSFYRIADGTAVGALIRVPVAPALRMTRTAGRGLRGTVRPRSTDAVAQLQRLGSGSWKTIAELPVSPSGTFARAGILSAGQYRARVSGLPGLVTGFSPVVVIGS
jgi:hypothetical protein